MGFLPPSQLEPRCGSDEATVMQIMTLQLLATKFGSGRIVMSKVGSSTQSFTVRRRYTLLNY